MKHWILGSEDDIKAGLAEHQRRIAAGQYNVIEAVPPSPEELTEWKSDIAEVVDAARNHAQAHPEISETIYERPSGLLVFETSSYDADPIVTLDDGSVIGMTEYESTERRA